MLPVGGSVLAQGPVRDLVPCGVLAGHQADARGRTDSASVSLGELHPPRRETLHVGCEIALVERCGLVVKWHRRLLPPHVVDEEKNDVRPGMHLSRQGRTGRQGRGAEGGSAGALEKVPSCVQSLLLLHSRRRGLSDSSRSIRSTCKTVLFPPKTFHPDGA